MDTALPENSTLIVKIKKEAMGSGKDSFKPLILNLSPPWVLDSYSGKQHSYFNIEMNLTNLQIKLRI
jgi:hypothetical protein